MLDHDMLHRGLIMILDSLQASDMSYSFQFKASSLYQAMWGSLPGRVSGIRV